MGKQPPDGKSPPDDNFELKQVKIWKATLRLVNILTGASGQTTPEFLHELVSRESQGKAAGLVREMADLSRTKPDGQT